MRLPIPGLLAATILVAAGSTLDGQTEGDHLYRVTLLQAAPGHLMDLIDGLRTRQDAYESADEPRPYVLRHSQGDHWDLMVIEPLGRSITHFYSPSRVERRRENGISSGPLSSELESIVAWRDETVFGGPTPAVVAERFEGAGLYHIEMFVGLAGHRGDLLDERRMENTYLKNSERPDNLIFARKAGGPWDSMTIGFYRNLQHYAEPSALDAVDLERIAKDAGFPSRGEIGAYLRRFLASHHDTLAVPAN